METKSDYQTLWSVTKLAEKAGVTPQAIRFALKEGKMEARKIGNSWVIPDSEAKNWLQSRNKASKK